MPVLRDRTTAKGKSVRSFSVVKILRRIKGVNESSVYLEKAKGKVHRLEMGTVLFSFSRLRTSSIVTRLRATYRRGRN